MKTTTRIYSDENIDIYVANEWMAEVGKEAEIGDCIFGAALEAYNQFANHLTPEGKEAFIKKLKIALINRIENNLFI